MLSGPSGREELAARQLAALDALLRELARHNPFYAPRITAAGLAGGVASLERFTASMPFTTKAEIVDDQTRHPPFGSNLTWPLERYVRCHQTSGTTSAPIRWLDTAEGWSWVLDCWERVLRETGVTAADRVFFPFSFGPFLGFWGAFDAAARMGCLALPGGGMGSRERLAALLATQATAVCSTPTYALHLGEVARVQGLDLASSAVRRLIVAGEPGGSLEATRERISALWGGARVFDHHGMTEIGPVSFPNLEHPGVLHVIETAYFAEVLDPATQQPVEPGQTGELVLTNLGRTGSPLLRYRTGDVVRRDERGPEELGRVEMALAGGILARTDDMVVVRGVNLYPSAIEKVIRTEPAVAEFRVELGSGGALAELRIIVEPLEGEGDPEALRARLERALRESFHLRLPVTLTSPGSLPRFELKARRWVRV